MASPTQSAETAFVPTPWSRRLLEPIGNMPPAEAEHRSYADLENTAVAA